MWFCSGKIHTEENGNFLLPCLVINYILYEIFFVGFEKIEMRKSQFYKQVFKKFQYRAGTVDTKNLN